MWGQVRFLKDNLQYCAGEAELRWVNNAVTRIGPRQRSRQLSSFGPECVSSYQGRRRPRQTNGKVLVLGGAKLPDDVTELLKKGPKYASEPVLSPPEKITLSRDVSRRVSEDLRPGCLSECVDVVGRTDLWT
ncbi:hypothetical protein HPB50_014917 [Hyalomma asiaticum]|uniref:Uncharacterized protein n=1 Tax=Hyalomma asiaticum TaxID=266040 RepID=A0ACB7S026_HYAAI|nr:hypothetical protein HPB50_014917 [Hyalomma asiaticum]